MLFVLAMLVFSKWLGYLSVIRIKPYFVAAGWEYNWSWPVLCLLLGYGVRRLIPCDDQLRGSWLQSLSWCLIGLAAGISMSFLNAGFMRGSIQFQGVDFIDLIFQIIVSYSEEYFFRGSLQRFLQQRFHPMVSNLLISVAFSLEHGFYPVLYQHEHFNWHWTLVSFIVSFSSGWIYARSSRLSGAYGIHLGWNLIASSF